jgi:predicted PurR-regulated permease PerM
MDNPNRESLTDLAKRAAVVGSVVLLLIVLIVGVGYVFNVLMLAFAGLLLALLFLTIAEFISQVTPLNERVALAVGILLPLGVMIVIGWFLVPQVIEQTNELQRTLPDSIDRLTASLNQYEAGQWILAYTPNSSDLIPRREDLLTRITGVFSTTLSAIVAVFVVFFIGLYIAAQPRMYFDGFIRLVPPARRGRAKEVMKEVGTALRWWLLAKLVEMAFIGLLVWLMLLFLGLPFALTLAVFAALLTFIPNFGPIISGIPAVLIGLLESPTTAMWVLVGFTAIQSFEGYILTPMIQQSVVSLPAALTIAAQILLGSLIGGVGLALATPLLLTVMVLVQALYIHDLLGDRSRLGAHGG